MSRKVHRKGDYELLLTLAAGRTVKDAAAAAGIAEKTAHRRLEDPRFCERVTRLRAEMIDRAAGVLADASSEAAQCLRQLLKAKSETVRLGAARALLELAFKSRELLDYEERLQQLEDMLCSKAD